MNQDTKLERAIEALLADRSPRRLITQLSEEQQSMIRLAQRLRGSRGQDPAPEFAERLHARLFPPHLRITRRGAMLSGLGTLAAGLIAGAGFEQSVEPSASWTRPPLVGAGGRWFAVADLADVPDGAIHPFSAGAVHGFLVHRQGRIYALSRICTHMGCMLDIRREEQTFECPCHGAEFDLQGRYIYGPRKYGQPLLSLPPLQTRVSHGTVEVFGV